MTSFLLAIGAVFTRLVRSLFSRLAGLCHERSFILDAARNAGLPSEDSKQLQSLLPRTVRALQLVEYAIHRAPRLRLAPLLPLLQRRLRESSVSPLTPFMSPARPRARVRTSVNMRERVLECSKSPAYNRLWEECAVASVNLAPLCFEKRCQGVRGSAHFRIYCESCSKVSEIPFSTVGTSRTLSINRRTVFANKC